MVTILADHTQHTASLADHGIPGCLEGLSGLGCPNTGEQEGKKGVMSREGICEDNGKSFMFPNKMIILAW